MNLHCFVYMQAPKYASDVDFAFKPAKTSDGWNYRISWHFEHVKCAIQNDRIVK